MDLSMTTDHKPEEKRRDRITCNCGYEWPIGENWSCYGCGSTVYLGDTTHKPEEIEALANMMDECADDWADDNGGHYEATVACNGYAKPKAAATALRAYAALLRERELHEAEQSSALEAVNVLFKALGWSSGGLGAAAIAIVAERDELQRKPSRALERLDAAIDAARLALTKVKP